ncbi:MAG: nucleoside deaminase [Candidatus Paceibacterota bacterium]|jgi:tRNA(Arg) A34 adenosine deaminase TadA|nr:nucleoside deaminase [Candidatus Paceibacterota bacterium]
MEKQEFMKRAGALARENIAKGLGGPFGCVVVKDGKIIAEGSNHVTTSDDPTAHAEIVAIRNACKTLSSFQLDGCEIYTSCEPCPMCLGAIYWARPEKVYYSSTKNDAKNIGFDDQFIYEEMEKDYAERGIPFERLEDEESTKAFHEWTKKNDKIEY